MVLSGLWDGLLITARPEEDKGGGFGTMRELWVGTTQDGKTIYFGYILHLKK